jgi:hypothetical protein
VILRPGCDEDEEQRGAALSAKDEAVGALSPEGKVTCEVTETETANEGAVKRFLRRCDGEQVSPRDGEEVSFRPPTGAQLREHDSHGVVEEKGSELRSQQPESDREEKVSTTADGESDALHESDAKNGDHEVFT